MEQYYSPTRIFLHGRLLFFTFLLQAFILLCMSHIRLESAALPTSPTSFGNQTDRLALLDLKNRISQDPLHVMSSWNDSLHFCSWVGVTCNLSTKRVVILDLSALKLVGSITPSIGNLTHLTGINLENNSFHGEIPQEMGRLRSLQSLNLSLNSFNGNIPTNISHCTQLRVISVYSNELIGSIPDQLSSLSNLIYLRLSINNLTGTIPRWIGNFSSLVTLYLGRNNFQGSIPHELGRLTGLRNLSLSTNNLSGMVPPSIYNISSIRIFSVSINQLHGELPPNLGITLPNLKEFYCDINKFTGNIPATLSNASRLQILDFTENGLSGALSDVHLGSSQSLVGLYFASNRLGTGKAGDLNFLSFLVNCTSLKELDLVRNDFGGELPGSIANLSTQLNYLNLGRNYIHGSIPIGIENLINLTCLGLDRNSMDGRIPDKIGKLQKLEELYLGGNSFSGPIPSSLGNLTSLTGLHMEWNRFEGSIPPSLGNCQNLLRLRLDNNILTGTIPKELFGLSSLSINLDMSNNYLTGSLPSEVGKLVHLVQLSVTGNKLSGKLPTTLSSCIMLVQLDLHGNEFEGTIPQSFKSLRSLQAIDISRNNLSGQIPEFLSKLTFLKYLNLSYNDFEGALPKGGVFSNARGFSILGNSKLCGGIPELRLPACSSKKPNSSQGLLAPKVVVPIACVLAFIISISCFLLACSMVKKSSRGRFVTPRSDKDWKSGVSYIELVESTNGFSLDNLIGLGSFGSVYKAVVPGDGTIVAVKVLNLQQQRASRSFIDECRVLRSIRHRNLLKIITACSSIDNQGNDFKSLVFEFMVNGSLDLWLHPQDDEQSENKRLSITQRLNIAIDVACALDYLHHHCETPIVHCDLKPSNVLLDEDMVAHVGDFGLARFLLEASDNLSESQTLSAWLKGSIGYIPPEYGMGGQVSFLGDIYSYGILLLEMFIGKRPTNGMFKDGLSIHQFTAMAMPDHALDIVDSSLLIERQDVADNDTRVGIQERPITRDPDDGLVRARRLEECLVSVMQIGLSCSATSPSERMQMDVVVDKMKAIKDSFLSLGRRR